MVLSLLGTMVSAQARAADCADINPEALRWLDKMSRSAQEVSYQGVVTFQRGGEEMQVMQISHSVSQGAASETLTQLTGQGAQVTRVEHPLECIHPGHKLLRFTDKLSHGESSSEGGACGISEHYRFTVGDGERVAGRKAVRIVVAPKDMYRYGYVMELDGETGLLVKARTIGRGGKVIERFQFANLSYTDFTKEVDQADVVHQAMHPAPGVSAGDSYFSGDWVVRWLPAGFTATDTASGGDRRRTYTDGLAVFSVFLDVLPRDIQPGEGVVRQGGTTSYTRGMRLNGSPALVTVIGEVPVNTARMAADSIARVQ